MCVKAYKRKQSNEIGAKSAHSLSQILEIILIKIEIQETWKDRAHKNNKETVLGKYIRVSGYYSVGEIHLQSTKFQHFMVFFWYFINLFIIIKCHQCERHCAENATYDRVLIQRAYIWYPKRKENRGRGELARGSIISICGISSYIIFNLFNIIMYRVSNKHNEGRKYKSYSTMNWHNSNGSETISLCLP